MTARRFHSERAKREGRSTLARQAGDGSQSRNERLSILVAAMVLVAGGAAAYWKSFDGQFVFDDQIAIVNNEMIRRLLPIERFFESSQPLTDISLAINFVLGGLEPWGYHLFNLLVHLASGLVLFGIVRRTIGLLDRRGSDFGSRISDCGLTEANGRRASGRAVTQESGAVADRGSSAGSTFLAFAIALLWIVHPLQTESVTYLIQRCESMMGLFYLSTLYAAIRAAVTVRPGRWMTISVLSCAAGMATKAVMVTAPVMVLLYDRTFLAGSFVEAIRSRWRLYAWLAATWLLLAGLGVFGGVIGEPEETATVGFGYKGVTPLDYLQSQPGVILHYLRLAVWPVGQCLDYGWQVARGIKDVGVPAAVIVGLIVATIWGTWRRHALGFAGAWFFLILLPTSSFVPIKDLAFEHRMYLPLAGVLAVVVAAIHAVLRWLDSLAGASGTSRAGGVPMRSEGSSWLGKLSVVGVLLAAGVLTVLTARRNALYADPVALWSQTVERSPANARARNALGFAMLSRGETDGAMEHFVEAQRLNPQFVPAYENMGKALLIGRRFADAAGQFERAIEQGAGRVSAESYFAYGAALIEMGRPADAVEPLRRSISLKPHREQAYYNLGNALWASGSRDSAVGVYQQALKVNPNFTEARVNLGLVLAEQGRVDEAIICYRDAIRLYRGDGRADPLKKAHYNLGLALRSTGKTAEATRHFREALRIDPGHRSSIRALEELGVGGGSGG